MKRNIKLILAYEGTQYLGWQKTITGPSIEEELEKAVDSDPAASGQPAGS